MGIVPWAGEGRRSVEAAFLPDGEGGVLAAIGVHSARPADLEPVSEAQPPLRVLIPRVGVNARIIPVGVETTGTMEVPADVRTVGWYRYGPSPGLPGSTVLIGHVDSRAAGPGVFIGLLELQPGDRIRVLSSGRRWESFEVVARNLWEKERLPEQLFSREGDPVLTLITCGGSFDSAAGRYTHNVVVTAILRT
ncbi:MAG: class F sortase [Actinomycetota bacterium]